MLQNIKSVLIGPSIPYSIAYFTLHNKNKINFCYPLRQYTVIIWKQSQRSLPHHNTNKYAEGGTAGRGSTGSGMLHHQCGSSLISVHMIDILILETSSEFHAMPKVYQTPKWHTLYMFSGRHQRAKLCRWTDVTFPPLSFSACRSTLVIEN